MKRKIIEIDEDKCDGCGLCVPDCPEGALKVVDGKVRLISDLFCDGLGACIKSCPTDAIHVVEREAKPYSESKVMENIVKKGANTIKEHLLHLKGHGETKYLGEAISYLKMKKIDIPSLEGRHEHHACPGSMSTTLKGKIPKKESNKSARIESQLTNWPVQMHLANPNASYFDGAHLLVAADCVPFAYADFHGEMLLGKTVVIGCPKLDDIDAYREKLASIIKSNDVKRITVARMEVPCCGGLSYAVEKAIEQSGKKIKLDEKIISIRGELL